MNGVGSWLLAFQFWLNGPLGKVGKESAAAKYAAATESNQFSIENERPYAEVFNPLRETFSRLAS